jgi:chorismate mutase
MVLELELSSLNNWLSYKSRPFVISGPCSAETEEQMMETAIHLSQIPQVTGNHGPVREHLKG